MGPRLTRAQVSVPGLRSGVVHAFGERRTLSVSNGTFNDSFAPLAVHIYVQSAR